MIFVRYFPSLLILDHKSVLLKQTSNNQELTNPQVTEHFLLFISGLGMRIFIEISKIKICRVIIFIVLQNYLLFTKDRQSSKALLFSFFPVLQASANIFLL